MGSYNLFLNRIINFVVNLGPRYFERVRQQLEMSKQKEVQKFKQNFSHFIKPHKCHHHNQNLNIVCIDSNCQNQGLICSICLTIKGSHKNHDAIDVNQYIQQSFVQLAKHKTDHQAIDLLARAQTIFDNLLTILSVFIDNCTQIIKTFISQRNEQHQSRAREINNQNFINKLIEQKFQTLPQANKLLKSLSSKYYIQQINKPSQIENKSIKSAQDYVGDISYETEFIGKELRKLEVRLKSILVVKQANPIVLNYQPTFYQPTLLQNSDLIYIGESKDHKPHGKGIIFHKNGEKVIYGQFLNGKVDGMGELYYPTGDYYLGQFKADKKNGRGVYRWNGKQYNVYEGEFKSGRRHGKGTFWWSDGSKYIGQFIEGQQTGYGVLYRSPNQKQYQGYWRNGQFNGKGIQYFSNGQRFQGQFKDDKFEGMGILFKEKQKIQGRWIQNELVQILNDD